MGIRALGTALALLVAALPAQPATAGLPRTLTLTGSHHATALLTVRSEVRYRLDGPTTARYLPPGRWAGFAIGTDWPQLWSGYVAPPHITILGEPTVRANEPGLVGVLHPGTYRVYLFADGHPVTISIRWTGPDTTLEFDTPLDARVAMDRAYAVNGSAQVALPLDAGRDSLSVDAFLWQPDFAAAPYKWRGCVARKPASWRTCDDRFARLDATMGPEVAGGGGGTGREPRRRTTRGLSLFAEVVGAVTGELMVWNIRYRP